MTSLFFKIEQNQPKLEGWCGLPKANALAAMVIALRPATVVELGVYGGKSLLPMALACKEVKHGVCYGVDPWDARVSAAEQTPEHAAHWSKVDHEKVYRGFTDAVKKWGVQQQVRVLRQKSDDVDLSQFKNGIQILSVDGDHGPQALRDVMRWCPLVTKGGFCILDDLDWPEVPAAEKWILEHGFVKLYNLGTGAVYSSK